ncbi:MAG TPA: proton-conducting transporter membrane subunit, partial [Chloroflexota bacterium]
MAFLALPLWFAAAAALCLALARSPILARRLGYGAAALGGAGCLVGSLGLLGSGAAPSLLLVQTTPSFALALRADALSAAFALALGAATTAVSIAAIGYGRHYDAHGGARLAALYNLFVATMLLVLLADGAFSFLIAWEAMSLVGYLLVAHEHEQAEVRRAGFVYLAMAHLGTAFVVGALFWLLTGAPSVDFAGLAGGAAALGPLARDAIFLALLIGFGTKAGLAPLHVWLPRAHPVAPSHVSALMSGVMLKVALYGLIRLAFVVLGAGPPWWGWLLLATGLLSALLGVLYALVDRDLKRVLAYSSVENVGIVAIGLGVALVAPGAIGALALTAALFHALNHALFKSLLFVGAGAVDQAVGSRDLDRLGGLARAMPTTSALFLVGALAIAAVPPLNGFASEWLTFQALLGLGTLGGASAVAAGVAAALLALTGGLSVACFVRAFGVPFLGIPRAGLRPRGDGPASTRAGLALLAAGCVGLGLLPGLAPDL